METVRLMSHTYMNHVRTHTVTYRLNELITDKGYDMSAELMVPQIAKQGGGPDNQASFSLEFVIQTELLSIIPPPPEPGCGTMAA